MFRVTFLRTSPGTRFKKKRARIDGQIWEILAPLVVNLLNVFTIPNGKGFSPSIYVMKNWEAVFDVFLTLYI